MDKTRILNAVLHELKTDLERQKAANETASDSATNSESRAESKWDTGGLEASYLARGYARQFEEMVNHLDELRRFDPEEFNGQSVGLGALVDCELDEYVSTFYLLPCCGGMELEFDGKEITIITPESPIGGALMRKTPGDNYALPNGRTGKVIKVL